MELYITKNDLGAGLINFRIEERKTENDSALAIDPSSLIHLSRVDGKKELRKNSVLQKIFGILSRFLKLKKLLCSGIRLQR